MEPINFIRYRSNGTGYNEFFVFENWGNTSQRLEVLNCLAAFIRSSGPTVVHLKLTPV